MVLWWWWFCRDIDDDGSLSCHVERMHQIMGPPPRPAPVNRPSSMLGHTRSLAPK